MSESKDEIRKRLLAVAETTIDAMLKDEVLEQLQQGQISLTEIEDQALAIRQQVGEKITQQMLNQVKQAKRPAPPCPVCGGRMQHKGHKQRQLVTRTGVGTVSRPYYHCAPCKQGHFPPG